ncbi:class I SAM-dependent methyltransferase [Roseovarius spongiae]|uniref:Class I SAM-dependent methyltransferase n=1 Tax=Roseovarius spongiae TaxID=2320272 RepID=A0A3A8AW16_9RHOB|nr:class I SAM-dependent methyltransferase [Roseovarius spongiae]RKF15267.1 class I SAM-dependent methyltransferase [Roseovarius spongiae]
MTDKFLDKIYGDQSPRETRALYDAWAASYEAEIAENGYATPGRCAAALWEKLPEPDAPILDFGCGTGLSGLALAAAGYRVIDGMDPSADMLERAREKALYRNLDLLDLDAPAPVTPGSHRAIAAIGVIGPGAAPPETLDLLMNALARDALLVFSFNDHALADARHEGRLNQWLDSGAARLLSVEHGDHLPGQDLKSTVYVVEKA